MDLSEFGQSDAGADQDLILVEGPVPPPGQGRWYVAHTRSRNEKALARELVQLGVFSYLPLTGRVTRSPVTRRVSRSLVPVFPGYLFFHGTEEQRYSALRTNRIANILSVANQSQLAAELLHVHALLANAEAFSVSARLRVGDWVRILAGPLRGIEGVVTRPAGRWRLHLNVTTLGQSVGIEVDADSVELIDPPRYLSRPGRDGLCRQ